MKPQSPEELAPETSEVPPAETASRSLGEATAAAEQSQMDRKGEVSVCKQYRQL